MEHFFKDKKILVIGGTGTIGQAAVKKLLGFNPDVIRILSRDEYKQFIMQDELKNYSNLRFLLGDVREKERLDRAMNGIDIVFDFAALKHVPACEYNPFEAVKTNVMGTQNVIECAMGNKVKRVIYTSSDKAVSPTNTMGATKLLAERLMSSAYYARGDAGTIFASVRFGNVMGSRGSVIPLFKQQIKEKGYITITEPNMTRFMMTMDQAVALTLKACKISKGGEVFILKMPVMKLNDLADVVIKKFCEKNDIDPINVRKQIIGLRPGEKLYEELMSEDEALKAEELSDMYAIKPFYGQEVNCLNTRKQNYSSQDAKMLTKDEIEELIVEADLV